MTRDEVEHLKRVLQKIKDKDAHVDKAIAICDKQIAIYDGSKGQLKEQYEDYQWGDY